MCGFAALRLNIKYLNIKKKKNHAVISDLGARLPDAEKNYRAFRVDPQL